MTVLKAPFPYYGGKSRIAAEVWRRFGDVPNLVEPFFGSGAVLLARPSFEGNRIETVNDADGHVCVGPDTRILCGDLHWIKAGDVNPGMELLGFDESNGPAREGLRAPLSYRRWQLTTVTNVRRVKKPAYRLTFDDGTTVVASADHLWLGGSHVTGGRGWRWQKTESLVCNRTTQRSWVLKLCDVVEREETHDAGWLAGFFDGEGNLKPGSGWGINVTQKVGPELERAERLLKGRGYEVYTQHRQRKARLEIATILLNGGMRESLRFLMSIRPERLIDNLKRKLPTLSIYGRKHQAVGLVSKEYLGETEVIAIETASHTFVAEGLASHNCNFWRALAADPDGVAYYADWPVSECVPAGTMIATPTGPVPVESIKEGMTVLGERNGVIVPTTVTATRQSLADDFYQVGELRLTGNHPVWTQDGGYMPAAHLVTGAIVARLNWPVCELDLIMLQSSYDKEDLDYLRPDRPTHGRDTLHRGICAPEGKVQRAFVKRGQGGQNASGLLDTVSGLSGGSTGLSSAGRSPRRKLARKRKVLDCVLSGTRAIDEYHRWGGRVARLHPDAGASPEVVANEERRQVRAGACCRNEGQTPHSRNAPKDFRGGASALCAGNAPKDFSSSKGTRYEQAPRAICGEAPRCTPDGRTSGKNRRQDHGAQAGSLHRDRASIRVHNGYGAILSGQRGFCLSSDPQRLPLQRLSSSPCVAVYNFQTQTGNYFADNILVHNCDLHARGDWLYYRPGVGEWVERLRADPDYYDIKSAGWWVWFASCWIGPLPTSGGHGNGVHAVGLRRPQLGGAGQHGQGINRVEYTPGDRRARLTTYLRALAARLERVRVCCGDWSRVCGPSVTHKHGLTAVFLDPPYSAAAGRDNQLYSVEDLDVAHAVRAWALENGDNPLMRIALCGYDNEGHEELETRGWHAHAWKANGGYGSQGKGRGRANAGREVVWFSPACINPIDALPLFRRNGHTPQVKL